MRYIDVLTAAATTRSVCSYEAVLDLHVTSSRGGTCFASSLKLRERVILALQNAGLPDASITEGGGNVALQYWSATKSVSHSISVRHPEMASLMNGMAAVEQLFASTHRSIFSPLKESFSFQSPKAIYAPSESAETAIALAMQRARATADAIAAAHGEVVDSLINVFEISVASQQSASGHDEVDSSSGMASDSLEFGDETGPVSYATLAEPKGRGTRRFRVRFALKTKDGG